MKNNNSNPTRTTVLVLATGILFSAMVSTDTRAVFAQVGAPTAQAPPPPNLQPVSQASTLAKVRTQPPAHAPQPAPSKDWLTLLQLGKNVQEGVVFEHEDGTSFAAINADNASFNPASTTKLATTLAVLRKFGPEHRFVTEVRINGPVSDQGELKGDLFVAGNYMLFGDRQARELVQVLNKHKIKSITGDLYVSPGFSMNLETTGIAAGQQLLTILDPWYKRRHRGVNRHRAVPQVLIRGILRTGQPPPESNLLVTHTSPALRDVLKIMLCYSDNTMAERFGEMVGGPSALTTFVQNDLGVPASEVHFATTSGLEINRVSPRAMITILRALRLEVQSHGLELSDFLDVAGVDNGTLKKRFTGSFAASVIAKTGTLTETDQGVSALAGEVHTACGLFLFVIFEKHGDYENFRARQDKLVKQFAKDYGGPAGIAYTSFLERIDHEDHWD